MQIFSLYIYFYAFVLILLHIVHFSFLAISFSLVM